jgi:hypothetical protein
MKKIFQDTKSFRGYFYDGFYSKHIRLIPLSRICDCGYMIYPYEHGGCRINEYPLSRNKNTKKYDIRNQSEVLPKFKKIHKNHLKKTPRAIEVLCVSGWNQYEGCCKPILRKEKNPCKTKPKIVEEML